MLQMYIKPNHSTAFFSSKSSKRLFSFLPLVFLIPLHHYVIQFIRNAPMLSPVIKKIIEERFGKEIRYPADCVSLQIEIEKATSQTISLNTIKRLMGFIQGTSEPRLSTLDHIAQYVHFRNWDDLTRCIQKEGNSEFASIEEVDITKLTSGQGIVFTYSPDREVHLTYIEGNTFEVMESHNSKLLPGDLLQINHFVLYYPLIVVNVCRENKNLGRFTAGKVSGLTSIHFTKNTHG